MLFSGLGRRIAKCRYRKCGRYFLLKPNRRRQLYENGLFCCIQHNRAESATVSVETRRGAATDRLIESAAREALRLSRNPKNEAELKTALVERLNVKLAKDPTRTRDEIKSNWVTRHWKEIEKRKGELSHAN